MADNLLKRKAIANYHMGLGWHTDGSEGDITASPENTQVMKAQKANPRRKFVKVGKAKIRIRGL